ncbi:MAG: hypothetical protein JXK05_13080 [Campylobacterales bacterium]|nr:hypothetical protein [Campylobacterales bacterium]
MKYLFSIALLCGTLAADGNHIVDELVALPHPLKALKMHEEKLGLSAQQNERLQKEVIDVFPNKIHTLFDQADEIEKRIKKAVVKEGKTQKEVAVDLDALTKVKRELTEVHIDALNKTREVLGVEKYEEVLELLRQMKEHQR